MLGAFGGVGGAGSAGGMGGHRAGQQVDERTVERLAGGGQLLRHAIAVGRYRRQRNQLLHAAQLAFDARQAVQQVFFLFRRQRGADDDFRE